ncbi:hypothetical protein AVEN_62677-1 [Araneus ventricosus]|uniref:Uncharacterized protein n=1 Tax=Araneus ventricosus TaxID=182803 RepID=A0A4Y2FIQ9_ARAVE|nr:hypothetical protein AVEN_62677-1 [Araneus ventricosus]
MERFAHDVCVHVLEKFGIFKAPDDTRKQNKYMSYDFLPCVSRSVVSYSIWIRDCFKNALDDKYETADPTDKEKMWNFFDDYLLQNDTFTGRDCTGKVCVSLALCTEYIQFVSTKGFTVSLNKLVIRWSDFFEKNLRINFEAEGGFLKLHSNLKSSQVDQLDNFHKAFISEYCLPYGARECTKELAKKCAEKYGIQLDVAIFGVNTTDIVEGFSVGRSEEQSEARNSEESQRNLPGSEEPKPEETRSETSDSEGSSSNTDKSEKTDSEISQNIGSEASDSEISQNKLLGIPPHEEMLREIDPFFVDNIPSPPKPRSASKSPERQPGSSDAPRSASKSPEGEPGSNDNRRSSPEQEEFQEKVEQILSNLEYDMEALRSLLFEHGLLSMKSGRRGSGMRIKDAKDKIPPKGPEGSI